MNASSLITIWLLLLSHVQNVIMKNMKDGRKYFIFSKKYKSIGKKLLKNHHKISIKVSYKSRECPSICIYSYKLNQSWIYLEYSFGPFEPSWNHFIWITNVWKVRRHDFLLLVFRSNNNNYSGTWLQPDEIFVLNIKNVGKRLLQSTQWKINI